MVSADAAAKSIFAPVMRDRQVRHRPTVAVIGLAFAVIGFAAYSNVYDRLTAAFLAFVLVLLAATDLEYRIVPNRIVVPTIAIVLILRIASRPGRSVEYVLAALLAGLLFLIPNLISRSMIGMGDVKLASLLGAALGWAVLAAVTVAFLSVFPFALATVIRRGLAARKATLPFAPFMGFGGIMILIVPRLVAG
jgi:prepilin signal peptidase PulO-like enzyme (type II secretory pathway)